MRVAGVVLPVALSFATIDETQAGIERSGKLGVAGNIIRIFLTIAMVAGVIGAGVFIFFALSQTLASTQAQEDKQPVVFTIEPGDTVREIADKLQSDGIIDSSFFFQAQLKLRSEDTLKAGKFQVTPGMDINQLITVLSTAPVDIGLKFTIIEGQRVEEIAEKLNAQNIVSQTRFLELTDTPAGAATFQDDFLNEAGRPADQGLEGYLFPDTYEIKQGDGDNSEAVVGIMLQTLREKFTPEMRAIVTERERNIHQTLTIASIVQREGVVKEELPTIAAVFWNRLDQGIALGADPTTQYAVAKSPDWWPNLDNLGIVPNTVDDPYNTYVVAGLPPGPICNPGFDAIEASVYPAETDYLYFVAKNDGTGAHAFATTLDEHERNRVIYGNR
ncbi:MAG: endolytic transglycosylase MltG [Chloroflexia bacterium]